VSSLFCRHNRFTAECPICSKDTVLSAQPAERAKPARRPASRSRSPRRDSAAAATVTRYPHATAGPFDHDGRLYEVHLEKVPGGLRLGEWRNGALERRAPVLPASGLRRLADEAREHAIVRFDLPEGRATAEGSAASAGRAGDMQEELRVETLPDPGLVRVARWIFWPGGGEGWLLQDAPVMLPENRFEQVLLEAAGAGLI
jgi:hypothetical protein